MLARNLDNSPAADDILMVASVYHDDMVAHGLTDDDAERVGNAFEIAGRRAQRFPRPVDVILNLPRPANLMLTENVEISDDEAKSNVRKIKSMLAGAIPISGQVVGQKK